MSTLNRKLAPLSSAAWEAIEDEARDVFKTVLAARKLVDFRGPLGWTTSAVDTGRIEDVDLQAPSNVEVRLRRVQPMVELRRVFKIARSEIEAIDRGADDADLDAVVEAAQALAKAEDSSVFNGLPEADIKGICSGSAHDALTIGKDYENYPAVVAKAISTLRTAGVNGPYAIALGPECMTGLNQTTVNGFPVLKHVEDLLDVAPVAAPALDGAVVLSLRGGDHELCVGRDFAIGYLDHDSQDVQFFIDESFTFRLLDDEAAIPLAYSRRTKGKR